MLTCVIITAWDSLGGKFGSVIQKHWFLAELSEKFTAFTECWDKRN